MLGGPSLGLGCVGAAAARGAKSWGAQGRRVLRWGPGSGRRRLPTRAGLALAGPSPVHSSNGSLGGGHACLREAWGLEVRRGVRALQAPPLQVLCPFSTFPRHICRIGRSRVTVAR